MHIYKHCSALLKILYVVNEMIDFDVGSKLIVNLCKDMHPQLE